MTKSDNIHIRPLEGIDELVTVEDLQRTVWQMKVDTGLVPSSLLLPISKNSGVVLGAFDKDTMIGFVISFMGRTEQGRLLHWSHMTGVLEEWQQQGIGLQLKAAQSEAVLGMGIDLIRWTVDPLEGRNNALNFGRLGVTCRTYQRNVYGHMKDALNRGIDSDRFIVDWEIDSERVKQRNNGTLPAPTLQDIEGSGSQHSNPTRPETAGLRRIETMHLDLSTPRVLIEVPGSFQDIKLHNLDLAIEWRMNCRTLFETYFNRGYTATEFVSAVSEGQRRNFYFLEAKS